jgi:hypothetical protein
MRYDDDSSFCGLDYFTRLFSFLRGVLVFFKYSHSQFQNPVQVFASLAYNFTFFSILSSIGFSKHLLITSRREASVPDLVQLT